MKRKHLFFELLHEARRLKNEDWDTLSRKAYLIGMMRVMVNHLEVL